MRSRIFIFVLLVLVARVYGQVDVVVPFTSSNLPIVVINTGGGYILDSPKIVADMGIIENGGSRNYLTNAFNDYSGKIGIEVRGSSSQMFPKKQYGIELRDAAGVEGTAASLLGMPEEEDWVLFAPYNDKSLMRDALAYSLGRKLGSYAPRTRFCELVLNNVYQGVYVLIEKVKRDKNRVDINKLDPDEVSGNNLTGGYIFKIDKPTGGTGEGWTSAYKPPHATTQQIYFQYEYPKAEDIGPEQEIYIQSYVKDFEDALKGAKFDDPDEGYAKYIDVNSFVDFFIMQEVTMNVDGYRLSTFLHKKRDSDGGKIFMGPIWDFNLGFGNANYCTSGNAGGWVTNFNSICDDDYWLIPFWWDRLLEDPTFATKVGERWSSLRATTFQKNNINAYIDSVYTVLNWESQQRNFTAWKVLGKYVWPNNYIGNTFLDEVNYLKNWISDRMIWLDSNMPSLITAMEKENSIEYPVTASPNPFSTELSLSYQLQKPGPVSIRIRDVLGRTVAETVIPHEAPGQYNYTWSATGPHGIYFYRVEQGTVVLGSGKLSKQ